MRWYREFSPSVQWTGGVLMLYGRELIDQFPVRKSKQQKTAFREAVLSYGAARGYAGKVESGTFGSKNVVFGDPEQAEYLVTAHYDTCARLPFPNFITPCHLSIYLLYQLFLCAVIILVPMRDRHCGWHFGAGAAGGQRHGGSAVYSHADSHALWPRQSQQCKRQLLRRPGSAGSHGGFAGGAAGEGLLRPLRPGGGGALRFGGLPQGRTAKHLSSSWC